MEVNGGVYKGIRLLLLFYKIIKKFGSSGTVGRD